MRSFPATAKDQALLSEFLLAAPMLLFALVAHEVAHGWTALRQGDDTAYKLGRITLNPLPHIDPMMTVLMPALLWFMSNGQFTFGGARPVPVVTRNFKNYVKGDLIVSSAGVITNFALAAICAILFMAAGLIHSALGELGTEAIITTQRMLNWGIYLNLLLATFNLIPIPPLDGSRLFYHALPPAWGLKYRSFERFGFLPLMVLLIFFQPLVAKLLAPAAWLYLQLISLAAPFAAGGGWNIFG